MVGPLQSGAGVAHGTIVVCAERSVIEEVVWIPLPDGRRLHSPRLATRR